MWNSISSIAMMYQGVNKEELLKFIALPGVSKAFNITPGSEDTTVLGTIYHVDLVNAFLTYIKNPDKSQYPVIDTSNLSSGSLIDLKVGPGTPMHEYKLGYHATVSTKPDMYRLAENPDGRICLQGRYVIQEGSGVQYEWRTQETVKLTT